MGSRMQNDKVQTKLFGPGHFQNQRFDGLAIKLRRRKIDQITAVSEDRMDACPFPELLEHFDLLCVQLFRGPSACVARKQLDRVAINRCAAFESAEQSARNRHVSAQEPFFHGTDCSGEEWLHRFARFF